MLQTRNGLLAAIGAFLLWGLSPLYWKLLDHFPAFEMVFHRMIWSCIFVWIILAFRKDLKWINEFRRSPKLFFPFLLTGLIISVNWFVYIWAVNHNYIVEASLGYFINPLINVILGAVFLRERTRKMQTVAILIAFLGVVYLTVRYGQIPWIALVLAFCFAIYGIIRKVAHLPSLQGLAAETSFLILPAFFSLLWMNKTGSSVILQASFADSLLIPTVGIITALPLLLFAYGAKRITYINIGLLQYIAPTMQFILGLVVYKESFPQDRFIGFLLIWIALLIYVVEGLIFQKQKKQYSNSDES